MKKIVAAAATAALLATTPAIAQDAGRGGGTADGECNSSCGDTTSNEGNERENNCGYQKLKLQENGTLIAISDSEHNRNFSERQTVIAGVITSGPGIQPVSGKGVSSNFNALQKILKDTPKRKLEPVNAQIKGVTVAECAMSVFGHQFSELGYEVNLSVVQMGRDGKHVLQP
jgi:hypothetical protein